MLHTIMWTWWVVLLLAWTIISAFLITITREVTDDEIKGLILAEPKPIKEKGLIFTNTVEQQGQTTCTVVCFNLDTREETVISTFTFDSAEDSKKGYYFSGEGMTREAFSDNFDRMAVTWCSTKTSERRAGWIDRKGRFFDVPRSLGRKAKGRMRGPHAFYSLGFAGRWFGYYRYDLNTMTCKDFYVPANVMRWSAVQEGTLEVVEPPDEPSYGPWNVSFWLASKRYDLSGTTKEFPMDWDMIRSPDWTKKAYMTWPSPDPDSDFGYEVYIEPVNGSKPLIVTGFPFPIGENDFALIDWR